MLTIFGQRFVSTNENGGRESKLALSDVPGVIFVCTEMENARCNIELGNNRFVQATEWKDQIRIDVREWELKDKKLIPTKNFIAGSY